VRSPRDPGPPPFPVPHRGQGHSANALEETVAFQRATIDHLLSITRQAMKVADIMSEQAHKALEAAQALAAQVHAAKVESDQLKADSAAKAAQITDLQGQLAAAQANAEDPNTISAILSTIEGASNELNSPAPEPQPEPTPEPAPVEEPAA
jgi:chromosome segregation ATPase